MRSLLTPKWILIHLGVVVLVVGFLLLGWWQVSRAAQGNAISFGYAIEWPVFAGFVVFVWIREMRRYRRGATEAPMRDVRADAATGSENVQERPVRSMAVEDGPVRASSRRQRRNAAAYDDSDDPELAEYNHYLAWRNAHPHATQADYPGVGLKENT